MKININVLTPSETKSFSESISEHFCANPFQLYPQLSKSIKLTLFKNEILSLIKNNSCIWTSQKSDQHCLLIYTPSSFDSEIFGYSVGRLSIFATPPAGSEILTPLIDQFLRYAHDHSIKFVTMRIDNSLCDIIRCFMQNGFYKLENFLTYVVSSGYASRNKLLPSIYPVNLYSNEPVDPFLNLAKSAFHHDHFHSDPFIDSEKSNEIFIHWIRNALQGQLGSKVLYAHERGKPLAFFSCRPRSEICSDLKIRIWGRGLAAVTPNSKGAYIALVNEALKRSPDYCDFMEFETQASNLMVLRIWAKYDFKLVSSFSTLHWRAF